MKRTLLSLLTFLAMSITAIAQNQMHVTLKNGSVMNVFVSEIEQITWDSNDDSGRTNDPTEPTVTGDATDITSYSATLTCYANNILENLSNDLKVGVIYCTEGTPNKSNGQQLSVSTNRIDADGKYTLTLSGLTEGTTYYYRSFVYQSGIWFYGKVRSFTTIGQNIAVDFVTGEATSITCYSAKVQTRMTITAPQSYGSMTYGICYGTTAEPTEQIQLTNKDANGNYSATLRALAGNTIYYYRPYAIIDGTTYYGATSSFKTLEDDVVTTGEPDENGNIKSKLTIGNGAYSKLELGVCWSTTTESPTVDDKTIYTNEVDDKNYFSVKPSFTAGCITYYRSYIKIDDVAHYGEVKTFEYEGTKVFVGKAIDLGLSVKWADMNIGANAPEDYGYYYAWGETEPKENYTWDAYFDSVNGSSTDFEKYATNKEKSLDSKDDVAQLKWKGGWRIPTPKEQQELLDNCYWEWTQNYRNTNISGFVVYKAKSDSDKGIKKYSGSSATRAASSTVASYNLEDSHIFLPAAGDNWGSGIANAGSYGYYWSSSLYSYSSRNANFMSLGSDNVFLSNSYRNYGYSVRAVCP